MLEVFTKFKIMVERQSSRKLKTLRTDGGGEYVSNDFVVLSEKDGIIHEVCNPTVHNKMRLVRGKIEQS